MRTTALATALAFALATLAPARPALAGSCYVDSDCPTGMVCNSEGGCVVPAGSTGNGNGNGHVTGTRMVLYAVTLGVVIVALLVPAMRATDEANGVRGLDLSPGAAHDQAPATCGVTLRF